MNKFSIRLFLLACLTCAAALSASSESSRKLVGILGNIYSLTPAEADALAFLYKSMPMSDRLMWNQDFYIRNVRTTLKAREEMPWGRSVPDDIWRHFVLPVRSNNEYIDNFRVYFYPELKERVKGLSMHDAALEVNHWLHEKVTYEPSDGRTSAPMATIRTAKGRCGEESVVGVAAFRTVGIPARQVYTPRWAHTDDNHAWVEVWIDGKWHFLGACEPEPELDMAWFNAPASRGMLMHTRVFGDYSGPEQIMSVNGGITEINVTDNYVPVREATVRVVGPDGRPCAGIQVEFKIYNYAEFYTAGRQTTDASGCAMLRTGKGNMLAWATDGVNFGFALIDSENTRLVLDHKVGDCFDVDIDIVPPEENPIPARASEEQIKENARRFAQENEKRSNYEKGFWGQPFCTRNIDHMAERLTPEQCERADVYLRKAKGNWLAIYDFLSAVPKSRLEDALAMLGVISDKDLRDAPAKVLINTVSATNPQSDNPLYVEYILNPRISNELLTDYRMSMRPAGAADRQMTVKDIVDYIGKIKISDTANAYRVPVTPTEVWKHREADSHSRDIFFVAMCRNNNIPARIDPVTGACQYHDGNAWVTVNFKTATMEARPQGRVKATFTPLAFLTDPEYYRHFSISSMDSGSPRLMEFGEDMGESFNSLLKNGVDLPAGYYMLTSGVRKANGSVAAHVRFFNVNADETVTVPLQLRHSAEEVEVIGSMNPEELYLPAGAAQETSILSTLGRGYFIIAVLGDTDEPSNHAALELASLSDVLTQWNRPLLLLGRERKELTSLPGIYRGSDPSGKVTEMLRKAVKGADDQTDNRRLPVIVLADSFGRVVFISEGYDTSLAQKLRSVISQL